jgi:flagellar FliJ protein
MTARSRLAALLALRTVQRDTAAAQLAQASTRVRDGEALVARTRAALEHYAPAELGVHELRAVAAARLAATSMLTDLKAADARAKRALTEASAAFTTASTRLRALERLDRRTREAARRAELAREQAAIDEIAQSLPPTTRRTEEPA